MGLLYFKHSWAGSASRISAFKFAGHEFVTSSWGSVQNRVLLVRVGLRVSSIYQTRSTYAKANMIDVNCAQALRHCIHYRKISFLPQDGDRDEQGFHRPALGFTLKVPSHSRAFTKRGQRRRIPSVSEFSVDENLFGRVFTKQVPAGWGRWLRDKELIITSLLCAKHYEFRKVCQLGSNPRPCNQLIILSSKHVAKNQMRAEK